MGVYKKKAKKAPARPRLSTGWRRPAPLLEPAVEEELAPVPVPVEPAEPDGLEPEDSWEPDEPDVAEDPDAVWVLVPLGTVLLPPALPAPPEVLLPDDAPPVGEAAPPPTTDDTRVVPFTAAGTPCGPTGTTVGATAVLVVAASGWVVTAVG